MTGVLISAAHKSSGKTTLSIGLSAALTEKGYRVQTFKKGPDYIDAHWLQKATTRNCYNLDFNTMTAAEIKKLYETRRNDADVTLIEANKGLYDGLHVDGRDSNAALAQLLSIPVVLVLDCAGVTRGIAPLVMGYQAFDKNISIEAIILNKVASDRHEKKLIAAIETYTDIPVLGAVRNNADLQIKERHLGLIPENEEGRAVKKIKTIANVIASEVDLESFIKIASIEKNLTAQLKISSLVLDPDGEVLLNLTDADGKETKSDLKIGYFRDAAFGFYYPDDLESLISAGAELIEINALKDKVIPDVDGLFIGGGFPETCAALLEENKELREDVKSQVENGLPVYAECGGLMYLCNEIQWQGVRHRMVGVIDANVIMHNKPQGRGYTILSTNRNYPWLNPKNESLDAIPAHEFHYSSLENINTETVYAYDVKRGHGIDGEHDGIVYKNCLANYTHFRNTDGNNWCDRFVAFVRKVKIEEL